MQSMVRGWFVSILVGVAVGACGGGDDSSESDALCRDLGAKVEECNLNIDTSQGCVSNPSESAICAARCVVQAECSQLTGPPGDNSYYRCLTPCSGGDENSFICADGSGFLPGEARCDGASQCPDGSDERGCDVGGGADADAGGASGPDAAAL
jgi:hypothetical protein